MIGLLRGKLVKRKLDRVLIDVQGVGYEVWIPHSYADELSQEGGLVELKIHTHVREDQLQLFGFSTESQKEMFQLLLSVSGVGPRVAMAVLSEMTPQQLVQVILSQNVQRLTAIPGIGKKTAERLVLETKEKMKKFTCMDHAPDIPAEGMGHFSDLVSALTNLGYKQGEVDKALVGLKVQDKQESFEELLRRSLQLLRS